MVHANDKGKCPFCGADFHGTIRQKSIPELRGDDLPPRFHCAHRIIKSRPCERCGRSEDVCLPFRNEIKAFLKATLINSGVNPSKLSSEALEKVLVMLNLG
jgi:C4-type Zn-finger protein